MKVAVLEGALLDYWVARACGNDKAGVSAPFGGDPACYWNAGAWTPGPYCPSTDWSHGGPIIDRERINVLFLDDADVWTAGYGVEMAGLGPTPLIAAMRAFVASKFGEEVSDEVTP